MTEQERKLRALVLVLRDQLEHSTPHFRKGWKPKRSRALALDYAYAVVGPSVVDEARAIVAATTLKKGL